MRNRILALAVLAQAVAAMCNEINSASETCLP
jgi:hypothetical protein